MLLDIILVALLVLACIKGFRRGLIVGLFSFIAIIVALAAAMKLSNLVANYLGENVNLSDRWLPFISFAIIFIVFVLLIRLLANLIQKTVELAMLGWLNRLGGMLLYIVIFLIVYSVILFYAEQLHLINETTIHNSVTYSFVQPWGPKVINGIGSVIPYFRDMFGGLEDFFERIAKTREVKA
jgi:membrane protein required for colicin V production